MKVKVNAEKLREMDLLDTEDQAVLEALVKLADGQGELVVSERKVSKGKRKPRPSRIKRGKRK